MKRLILFLALAGITLASDSTTLPKPSKPMASLISRTAELALDILEKEHALLPFCKLTDQEGAPFVITPDGGGEHAYDSVAAELGRRLAKKEVKEFALCTDVLTKFAHEESEQRCLRIEFQDGSDRTGIYYFPLTIQDGKAVLGRYSVAEVKKREL